MSFEIASITGETRLLHSVDGGTPGEFVDGYGRRYAARFDGNNVMFDDDAKPYIGQWLQGTAATVIPSGGRLGGGFIVTFMDHGPRPQRLHALWTFDGAVVEAIARWKAAGFFVSRADRYLNRNRQEAVHLRTWGAFPTGADSSHVVIPVAQAEGEARGDIHVGEFNPLTGFGVGFVLHQLEGWMGKSAVNKS